MFDGMLTWATSHNVCDGGVEKSHVFDGNFENSKVDNFDGVRWLVFFMQDLEHLYCNTFQTEQSTSTHVFTLVLFNPGYRHSPCAHFTRMLVWEYGSVPYVLLHMY